MAALSSQIIFDDILPGMDIQGSLLGAVILIVIILVSLSVHEFAHAFVANLFGDSTAKDLGRMSVNPIKHWDPIGTTLLVGLLFLNAFSSLLPVFGWGKPVPVDERNFENPKLYGLQVALAGPMSNFLLAVLAALGSRFLHPSTFIDSILQLTVYLNLFLMFFNLLPIPPLDGSRLLRLFLPAEVYFALASNPFFFIIVIFLALSFLLPFLQTATTFLSHLLLG